MTRRTKAEKQKEWEALCAAQIANATARDSFLAVAHTALFAASIAFVSDWIDQFQPRAIALLLLSWLVGAVGLIALTVSYVAAQREIQKRQDNIHEDDVTNSSCAERLNHVAVVTFPISLLLTFLFSSINVLYMSENPRPSPAIIERGVPPAPRMPAPSPGDGGAGVVPPPRMPAPTPAPSAPSGN